MQIRVCLPNPAQKTLTFLEKLNAGLVASGHYLASVDSTRILPGDNDFLIDFDAEEESERTVCVRSYDDGEVDRILSAIGGRCNKATLSVCGIEAAEAETRLKGLSKRNIKIVVEPNFFGLYVRIYFTDRATKIDVDVAADACAAALGNTVYAREETGLETFVIKSLLAAGRRVSIAESFTGGGIAAMLTGVPKSSEVVTEGVVAYTEEAKKRRLGVSPQTLAFDSAVSVNCVYQMATGLLTAPESDIVVATTGYAGPTGADVGKCYIAVGDRARVNIFNYNFSGTRKEVTESGVRAAILRLAEAIAK